MDYKRLAANQWLNRIIIIVTIIIAIITMLMVDRIDKIVNGQLYQYGLQFNSAWANPYWGYAQIIYIGLSITIALSALTFILGLMKRKNKTPEITIKEEQPQPKAKPQPVIQPKPQPAAIQPKPQPVAIQQEKPKQQTSNKPPKEKTDTDNFCPNCKKAFTRPLVMLNFEGGKSKLVNVCPYCNQELGNTEEEEKT